MEKKEEEEEGKHLKGRITPKEAAVKASQYFTEMVGPRQNITVEEVELSKSGSHWLITLGYQVPPLGSISFYPTIEYKIFEVDASTGEVVSMKIREVGKEEK